MTSSLICLAAAIYFECSVCSISEKVAVGFVVQTRAEDKIGEFKRVNTVCDVIKQKRNKKQFSFYHKDIKLPTNKRWDESIRLAKQILNKEIDNPIPGATHYHVKGIYRSWESGLHAVNMEHHVFFLPISKY